MQQISEQEQEIMRIIWEAGDSYMTARDIERRLFALDEKTRNLSSLMTVLARLVDKGFLKPEKKFRELTYFVPLVEEAEYKAYATRQFIRGIHKGRLTSFVSALLEGEQYTQQDIDELRNILEQKGKP